MDKIIQLCVRRAILFPSAELYGGMAGFFDYGPYGVELKKRLEDSWWKRFVSSREDVVGIDGSIVTPAQVWKASGHLETFNDPLIDCKKCKNRFRADHLLETELKIPVDGMPLAKLEELIKANKIKCQACQGELNVVRSFNLMFKTNVGPIEDAKNEAYLRPETAQLIFANFKRVMAASRMALPFGMAQIGKAFRNEISPRNFVFRCREFSQMEVEYFVHPSELDNCPYYKDSHASYEVQVLTAQAQEKKEAHASMSIGSLLESKTMKTKWHAYWVVECLKWFEEIGIRKENLRLRQHVPTELSHYSAETWDVEYNYPWGWKELMGVANRSDYDLRQHMKESQEDLRVYIEASKEKVLPHVIEPSAGVERTLLTLLFDSYREIEENGEKKVVLGLKPQMAPIQVAIFPLMKKDGLAGKAHELYLALRDSFACEYDDSGSIGKRYARVDELGCPFAITIDYDSLSNGTVTLRERDSRKQELVIMSDLKKRLSHLLEAKHSAEPSN